MDSIKKIRENTVENMKKLNTFKPEYEPIVQIYAELCYQYQKLTAEWRKLKYVCGSTTAAGGGKKHPLVSTLESLRKDILAYSDRLCLNPKSMMEEKTKKPKGKSRLDKIVMPVE